MLLQSFLPLLANETARALLGAGVRVQLARERAVCGRSVALWDALSRELGKSRGAIA